MQYQGWQQQHQYIPHQYTQAIQKFQLKKKHLSNSSLTIVPKLSVTKPVT